MMLCARLTLFLLSLILLAARRGKPQPTVIKVIDKWTETGSNSKSYLLATPEHRRLQTTFELFDQIMPGRRYHAMISGQSINALLPLLEVN